MGIFSKIIEALRTLSRTANSASSSPISGDPAAPDSIVNDPTPLDPPRLPTPPWVFGRKGEDVRAIQKKLITLGFEITGGADGSYGKYTLEAAEDFKEDHDVVEEGLGPLTLKEIEEAFAALSIPADLVIDIGDTGPKVTDFQKKLILLGHDLPRFGADGGFGDETLVAVKEFQIENPTLVGDEDAFDAQGVGPKTYQAVLAASSPPKPTSPFPPPPPAPSFLPGVPPSGLVVTKDLHPLKKGSGTRSLVSIKGVTLHQTATVLGEDPKRWYNVACHIAITLSGKIIYNNDFLKVVWHGNGFNSSTIGIEIDGHYAGIENYDEKTKRWVPDLSTYWRPASQPNRIPLSVTDAQVEACKQVIRWIQRLVNNSGGEFKYILAHRQSSPSRLSDPGGKVWKLVVLPLLNEGLSDGGPDFYILDSKKRPGKPLPEAWDAKRHPGVKYRVVPKNYKGRPTKGP